MPLLSFLSGGKKQQQPPPKPSELLQAGGRSGRQASSTSRSSGSDAFVGVEQSPTRPQPSGNDMRLRLPLFRKNKHSSGPRSDAGSVYSDAPPTLPEPVRTSVFGNLTLSTHSLPLLDAVSNPSTPGGPRPASTASQPQSERPATKKRTSVFSFSTARDSAPPKSAPPDEDSFNLRSFRQIRPPSPIDLSSPTPRIHTPGRSRNTSAISESASGMKVSDFRARARRSSTSLPMSPSPRASAELDAAVVAAAVQTPPRLVNAPAARPARQPAPGTPKSTTTATPRAGDVHRFRMSSGETSTEEDEEDNSSDDSLPLGLAASRRAASPGPNLARDSTITKRPPRSEAGHSMDRLRPSLPSSRSESGHSSSASASWRQNPPPLPSTQPHRPDEARGRPVPQPVKQTSRPDLTQTAVKKGKGKERRPGSDTSDDSDANRYGSESEDNAPLGKLVPPKRPGSSLSVTSASSGGSPSRRAPGKPLVDINAPSNMNQPPPLPKNLRSYARPRTESAGHISVKLPPLPPSAADNTSPSPSPPKPLLGDRPPAPVRVSTRETNSGFAVLSRPNRQSTATVASTVPASSPSSTPNSARPASTVNISSSPAARPVSTATTASTPPQAPLSRPPSGILKAPSPHFKSDTASRSSSPSRAAGSSGSSAYLSPASAPPRPPFTRGQSPASSAGSTGPVTPADGSDRGSGGRYDSTNTSVVTDGSSSTDPLPKPPRVDAHGRRYSVSFEEPENTVRGRSGASEVTSGGAKNKSEARRSTNLSEEDARKERRRSEAKAAIELGNAIHGPTPVFDDEPSHAKPGMPLNYNPAMFPPGAFGMPTSPMFTPSMPLSSSGFMMPPAPAGADSAFIAAHQQAMIAAKQAYQMAVAQQAMAAAGDEWERSSNVSGWGGMGGGMGMMPQMGMQMPMQMPMQMQVPMMQMPMMFPNMLVPPTPFSGGSVYGGSTGGSSLGTGPVWGSGAASVYGESFGPSTTRRTRQSAVPFPASSSSTQVDRLPTQARPEAPRQRAKTGPSGGGGGKHVPSPLVQFSNASRGEPPRTPPSSWNKQHFVN